MGGRAAVIDEAMLRRAAEALLRAAPPGSQVILFGSQATGKAGPDSDLDFLVIEPQAANRLSEMFRLRQALDAVIGPLLIPADVLVTSQEHFDHWRDTPGTVYYAAAQEGRVYERVA